MPYKCYLYRLSLLICFIASSIGASAQDTGNAALDANALKSGNYKDVFASFFRLAFDSLTGPNKELNFSSNPFAIMARADTTLLWGDKWYKYRHLRALNFSVGLKADTNYRIRNFSAGLKYAIINRRDLNLNRGYYFALDASDGTHFWSGLGNEIDLVATMITDGEQKHAYREETNKLRSHNSAVWIPYSELSDNTKNLFEAYTDTMSSYQKANSAIVYLMDNPDSVAYKVYQKYKDIVRDEFLNKPLLTASLDGASFTNQLAFEHVYAGMEFLFGIPQLSNKPRTFTTEMDIKARMAFQHDSFYTYQNLNSQVFAFEPGINFALRTKDANRSYLEFKLSGSYYHNFSGLRDAEKADSSTLNAEVRLRVYDDIWIPVVVKYDPRNKNLFGFLNISANFTALGNLLGKKQNQ